jgi:membrane-associated phospholipid phosphatase
MDNQESEQRQKSLDDNVQKNVLDKQPIVQQAQKEVMQSRVPWYLALKRTQVLIAVYLVIFALFLVLAWFVHVHPVLSIDVAITQEFQEQQLPWLNWFMVAVSFLGNQFIIFSLLILLTAVIFWLVRLRLEAVFIVGLSVVSTVLNGLIKYIVSRPRPTSTLVDVIQRATGQSFPSGHVMSYVAYWGLLFSLTLILFKRNRWWQYLLLIVSGFFVVTVGPSRIYLGDHWASDVLGAYMFGGLLLGIALWLYLSLKEKGVLAPKDKRPAEHVVDPPTPEPRPSRIPAQS